MNSQEENNGFHISYSLNVWTQQRVGLLQKLKEDGNSLCPSSYAHRELCFHFYNQQKPKKFFFWEYLNKFKLFQRPVRGLKYG
ncbi:sorting nexin-16 isoform X1 [Prionailurus iriomotensis]